MRDITSAYKERSEADPDIMEINIRRLEDYISCVPFSKQTLAWPFLWNQKIGRGGKHDNRQY